ncbi:MAG: MotA/TolQ/ExbB proton channel family protein [Longimicrobiales bacterium]
MGDVFHAMGFMAWPLTFSLLTVVGLSLWSAAKLFQPNATADLKTKVWLDAILFWGGFAFLAGLLGTLVGIIIAAQSIEMAGEVHPTLVWGGIKVALLTSAFGMLILGGAGLSWFGLQLRWRSIFAREMEGVA